MQSNPIPGMNWRNSWVTQSTHIAFYIPRKEHKALPERKVLQRQCHKLPWDCQGPRGHPLQNTIWQTPEVMWDFLLASSVFFASHPKHFRPCSAEVATENSCDVLGPYCDFLYLTACFQGKGWLKNMGHWGCLHVNCPACSRRGLPPSIKSPGDVHFNNTSPMAVVPLAGGG